jgi:hypothetical protein
LRRKWHNDDNRAVQDRIMYIERKMGGDTGPARIGRVAFSQTGRTLYYAGKTFQSLRGRGIYGNYAEVETGEEYWISGCKKDGADRHRFARRREPVEIDDDVRREYWAEIRGQPERSDEAISNR